MPVALDLVRVVTAALPIAGVLALVAGVATLVLALRRRGRATLFAAMGGATLLLTGAALLGLAWITGGLR